MYAHRSIRSITKSGDVDEDHSGMVARARPTRSDLMDEKSLLT